MNLSETKKDVYPEIKKILGKSKLEVLTNENVKNFLNNKIFKNSFLERNNDYPKYF